MRTGTTQQHKVNNVCTTVVARDLCIGCGVCAGLCPRKNLRMAWNQAGLLRPEDQNLCSSNCSICLDVCPFVDHPENEDTLAAKQFGALPGIQHAPATGYYLASYVGHANSGYREQGASGGLASWFLAHLLETGQVDHVLCVRPKADSQCLFEFSALSTPDQVRSGSRSAYYPVELSGVLEHVLQHDRRYALIGLPCFIKGVRLACGRNPVMARRIAVCAGLVCGQTKSRLFAEYLIRRMGLDASHTVHVSFRSKNPSRAANDFELQATIANGVSASCPWTGRYAETWCSGMFTPRACTFCDDIFAETADIAFMDAWLPEYTSDSRGTSLVLVRSPTAKSALTQGINRGELHLSPIPIQSLIASQAGVIAQKRTLLPDRIWLYPGNDAIPKKRARVCRPGLIRRALASSREWVRARSFLCYLDAASVGTFDSLMRSPLQAYHRIQKLFSWQQRILQISRRLFHHTLGARR